MNTIPFWTTKPTILFNKQYIFELYPTNSMSYEQKLNAITRLIIFVTILGYILTASKNILYVGILTLVVIFVLYNMKAKKITREMLDEGFKNDIVTDRFESKGKKYLNPVTLDEVLSTEFKEGNKKNPFSNVLLTEIMDEPERKSAPPAFNVDVDEDITRNVKRTVQRLNPEIKNTNKQLFGDLWQQFQLDQSNRVFYSTPNTRVTSDQGAYGKFLYGNMPSAKESTPEGNMQRYADAYRYTLY